jgi:hypothetical protein
MEVEGREEKQGPEHVEMSIYPNASFPISLKFNFNEMSQFRKSNYLSEVTVTLAYKPLAAVMKVLEKPVDVLECWCIF